MRAASTTNRLLWNKPSVVGQCAIALFTTIAIIAWQLHLRAGVIDPTAVPIFYRLFLFEDYPAALLTLLVLLLALVPGMQELAARVARLTGGHPVVASVAIAALLAAGAFWVYRAQPLAMDESAPYLQAQIFAQGALVGQLPPTLLDWLVFPPFQDYFIHVSHVTGEIASAYWPGFAMLLTPFVVLGVPWLCNPLLGGLAALIIHRLTLELSGSRTAAGAAMLFTAGSAAFVVNAISFYSMTAHLLCNALFALLLLRPSQLRALAAGFVGGLALNLHNPIPHMLFALPWLAWLAAGGTRRRLLPALLVGYLPWVTIVGFGWHDLLQSLVEGGPAVAGATPGGLRAALATLSGVLGLPGGKQLMDRSMGLAKLWLWAAPALVLVAGVGGWRNRQDARVRLLAASAVLTFVGYLFVPLSQGHGWGFRYFHSSWFVLPVLAALVVTMPDTRDLARLTRTGSTAEPSGLGGFALAAALWSMLLLVPFFMLQVQAFVDQHLAQLPGTDRGTARVLIVNPMAGYYAQDLVQNDPFLSADQIRMVTHGRAQDEEMMARNFPQLVLLSSDHRGSVWGTPPTTPGMAGRSEAAAQAN